MILDESIVNKTLLMYGINYSGFDIEQREALLASGKLEKISDVLNYLVNELGISPKSIEKCPSIMYLNTRCIKDNYEFLISEGLSHDKISNCLHILSTPNDQLKDTYGHIVKHYGRGTFNKNLSVLAIPVSRIEEIQERLGSEMKPSAVLSAAISTLRIPEIASIVRICRDNDVEVTGSFFQKGLVELTSIINICHENNIDVTGSVFRKSSLELKRIISVCREKNVPITGSVFLKDASEIEKIVDVCTKYSIPITGSVFRKDASEIEKIVSVCNELGISVSGTVFLRDAEEIRKIVDTCRKNGITIVANVFKKSADEIEDIISVCKKHGVEVNGSLFSKSASSLDKSMTYLSENYGRSYLEPLIVVIDSNHLGRVFPHLDSRGTLQAVISNPAILTLKFDEILDRENFIRSVGEEDIVNGRFNSIYGLSRKEYDKKVKISSNLKGVK